MGKNKSKKKPQTEFSCMKSIMAKLDNELAKRKAVRQEKKANKEKK